MCHCSKECHNPQLVILSLNVLKIKPVEQASAPSYLCPCLTCLTPVFVVWGKNVFPRSKKWQSLGDWGGRTLKFRNHLALTPYFKWTSGGSTSYPVSSRDPFASREQSAGLLAPILMFTLRHPAVSSSNKASPSQASYLWPGAKSF